MERRMALKGLGTAGLGILAFLHCGRDPGLAPPIKRIAGPSDELPDFDPNQLNGELMSDREAIPSAVAKTINVRTKTIALAPERLRTALGASAFFLAFDERSNSQTKAPLVIHVAASMPPDGVIDSGDYLYIVDQNGRMKVPPVSAADFTLNLSIRAVKWYQRMGNKYYLVCQTNIRWE